MITAVLVHAGDVSVTSQRSNEEGFKVAEPSAESLARGETDWLSPLAAADSSGRAVGGASVVKEIVLLAFVPRVSATEYVTVDVPTKPASPVNVTTPVDVFTEYDPSPVTVSEVAVQFGALSADHLEASGDKEIEALAQSNTIAVALPGASVGLGCSFAPARKILNKGFQFKYASLDKALQNILK